MSLGVLEGLRREARGLVERTRGELLALKGTVVAVAEDPGPCPACGGSMKVQKSIHRNGKTLAHGDFEARETVHACARGCRDEAGCPVFRRADSLLGAIPRGCVVGYDVMVHVGLSRFLLHRQREEIRAELDREYGLSLASGEVSALFRRFLGYLERLHVTSQKVLAAAPCILTKPCRFDAEPGSTLGVICRDAGGNAW